jgi:hypothetical protein
MENLKLPAYSYDFQAYIFYWRSIIPGS